MFVTKKKYKALLDQKEVLERLLKQETENVQIHAEALKKVSNTAKWRKQRLREAGLAYVPPEDVVDGTKDNGISQQEVANKLVGMTGAAVTIEETCTVGNKVVSTKTVTGKEKPRLVGGKRKGGA